MGADPEHRMREALMLFIKENREKVTTIAAPFLRKKKLSLDEYIAFMSIPGNRGDEPALHLLAVMSQIHYCVITKTKIYYSHPSFNSPSDVNIALVYLGNCIFQDTTTLAKICPPPSYINVRETFPGDFTPFTHRELGLRNRQKRWRQDQLDAQECPDPQDAQECPDPQDTQEKHKSPPCQTSPHKKGKNKKKVKVVHSKEYKIRWPKKRPVVKKCSLCSESFDLQLELNLHTKSVHKFRFMCSSRQCGKTFGSLESLKKHRLRHGEMKYLCQDFVVRISHLLQIWLAMQASTWTTSHLGATSVESASNGGQAANYTLMKNIRRKVLVMNSKHFCIYFFSWYKLFNTKFLVFASVYVCPGIFSFTLC